VSPFIDESVGACEVTLHRETALSAGGIPIRCVWRAVFGVSRRYRFSAGGGRAACDNLVANWSRRLRIFNRGEMRP